MKYGRLDATDNYTKKTGRFQRENLEKYDYDDNFYDLEDDFLDDDDMKNVNVNMVLPEVKFKDFRCIDGDYKRLGRSKFYEKRLAEIKGLNEKKKKKKKKKPQPSSEALQQPGEHSGVADEKQKTLAQGEISTQPKTPQLKTGDQANKKPAPKISNDPKDLKRKIPPKPEKGEGSDDIETSEEVQKKVKLADQNQIKINVKDMFPKK